MHDGRGSDGSKVAKILLIVAAVLLGTTAICCTGTYFAGSRVADEVQKAVGPVAKGSGVAAVQQRLVGDFQAIRVEGVIDVDVTIGEPASVTLQADDNLLPLLTTEVVDGTLTFSSRQAFDAETDVRATVVVPALRAVSVNGVGDLVVRGLDEPTFKVTVRGIGDVGAQGRVDTLDVEVHGVGSAYLDELQARVVRAKVKGIGDAEVYASESLEASIEGMGDVTYFGSPGDVNSQIDGMGSVSPGE